MVVLAAAAPDPYTSPALQHTIQCGGMVVLAAVAPDPYTSPALQHTIQCGGMVVLAAVARAWTMAREVMVGRLGRLW